MNIKYLKNNIAIEPLFCSWYLWTYLVPPHTAGFYLKNRYLKTMKSFIESPEVHQSAANNPKLAGGQFMNISSDHCSDIQKIMTETEQKAKKLLQLANDIEKLDETLQAEADGRSLENLYSEIPSSLRGCIELVYDRNNHPSIHFFERIIYNKYYDSTLQSIVLSPLASDQRKFVFSTPRLATKQELKLPISFDSPILSSISHSRQSGVNFDELLMQLNLNEKDTSIFESLFSEKPTVTSSKTSYDNDGIRIRYFGHASVLIQTNTVSILIDPLLSYFRTPDGIDRYTLDDLPDEIDYVLFTHSHLDHIAFETLIFLKSKVKSIVIPPSSGGTLINPNLRLILETLGFKNIISLDYLQELHFSNGRLFSFPFLGEHGDLDIQSKSAFYLEINTVKLLFAADSNNLDNMLYEYLDEYVGKIDVVFIGMECVGGPLDWIYGPLLSKKVNYSHKQSRRYSGSNSAKALKMIKSLGAKEVYVYAMGQEKWLSHITSLNYESTSQQIIESDRFIAACRQENIPAKRLYGKDEWQYNANYYHTLDKVEYSI